MIKTILVAIAFLVSQIWSAPVQSNCPSLSEEEQQKVKDIRENASDYFLPPSLQGSPDNASAHDLWNSQFDIPENCPVELPSSGPVYRRSSCPWTLSRHSIDANRFPTYIFKAVPLCNNGCVGSLDRTNYGCERVYMDVNVLRKVDCGNGLYRWVPGTERVPVAATCVRRSERESSVPADSGAPPSDY